jgi:hydrophobic/amphiphilic exporter-1 (mainly G- bacteria), HAE1 family
LVEKIKGALLPTLSVNRPVTVTMVLICTLVLGLIAYNRVSLQLIPQGFNNPWLSVYVSYGAQANPYEVEKQLTRPIEEMLRTVRGISMIRSWSNSSSCSIQLGFDSEMDMKQAYAQVRDRLERVRPQLPNTVRQMNIFKFRETDIPVMEFGFYIPKDFDDAYYIAENKIKRALERIDGVAKVQFYGIDEKQIFIEMDRQRVLALKIDLYTLMQRLQQDNFVLSSGYLKDGGTKFLVRSMGRFSTIESIENLPIGRGLRLKDIAEVSYRTRTRTWFLRGNREPVLVGSINKESLANTVEVCKAIENVLANELPRQPGMEQFQFVPIFSQGQFIVEAVDNIKQTCLWGGIFAVLILFFFLRSYRMTLIITLAIPLTLLFTIVFLFFMDWSLNLFTMLGMMLSIGMVVDNSIVVVENIYRARLEGSAGRRAAVEGASEVSLAITMSTLTTVVVFLPLILMNQDRQFTFIMARIGMPVIIALLASLLVALFFIPLGTIRIAPKPEGKQQNFLNWLNRRYIAVLNWTLNHRLDTTIILVVVLASSIYPQKNLRKYDWRDRERNEISVNYELPGYTSWERSHRLFEKVENFLMERKERYRFNVAALRYNRTWGNFHIMRPVKKLQWYEIAYRNIRKTIGSPVDTLLTYQEVCKELNDSLPRFPDTRTRVNWSDEDSESDPSVNIVLYGDDTPTLSDLASGVQQRLAGIPGMVGVDTDIEKGNDELLVNIDRDLSRRYGLDAQRIAQTVAYGGSGMRLSEFRASDREINIYLQYSDTDSSTLHKLRNTPLYSSTGRQVTLGTVADFSVQKSMWQIRRENGKTYLRVNAKTTKDASKDVFQEVDKAMEGFEMPRGYSWDKGRMYQKIQEKELARYFGIIMAIVFVFLLMGILFESFILPLNVITIIPFSFFGAYWLLFITDTSFDELSGIGLIILIGVVVNNGIVLVDMIQRFRAKGLDRTAALIEAGKHRFRPILMTAATTIGGLIPIAVGGAKFIDISYAPMGRTLIGGLVTATLMTLLAVPLLYTFLDDLRGLGSRMLAGFFSGGSKKSSDS